MVLACLGILLADMAFTGHEQSPINQFFQSGNVNRLTTAQIETLQRMREQSDHNSGVRDIGQKAMFFMMSLTPFLLLGLNRRRAKPGSSSQLASEAVEGTPPTPAEPEIFNPKNARMNPSSDHSGKAPWLLLAYLVLCFHHFGVVMMVHFFNYPAFRMLHENVRPVFEIFNQRMILFAYVPAGLLAVAALALWWKSAGLPRWLLAASAGLGLVSVAATFLVAAPVYAALPATGFTAEIESHLLPLSLGLQVLPAAGAALLALVLMNSYLHDSKLVGRWLFIGVFALLFYSFGTGDVDANVDYAFWPAIGPADWLLFRHAGSLSIFVGLFLLPAFLPILLKIPLIWLRPPGLPKLLVLLSLAADGWVFFITATYFVPRIQLPLDKGYSLPLIEALLRNNFPLRGSVILAMYALMAWMFLKVAPGLRWAAPRASGLPAPTLS